MSKCLSESQMNTPKTWNGGTWYYFHKYTGGKCDGQHRKHNPSECQCIMKKKPIHSNTSDIQDGDIKKSNNLKIASAIRSVIVSNAEDNE